MTAELQCIHHYCLFEQTPNEALPFGTIPLYEELQSDLTGESSQKSSPDTAVQERPATDTVTHHPLSRLSLRRHKVKSYSATTETVTVDSPPVQVLPTTEAHVQEPSY
jgi:hypothetical protein